LLPSLTHSLFLAEALNTILTVASLVNESIRQKENSVKLLELQELLPDLHIIKPGRELRHRGVLLKVCRKGPQRRAILLVCLLDLLFVFLCCVVR
jgi:hypothetical protein